LRLLLWISLPLLAACGDGSTIPSIEGCPAALVPSECAINYYAKLDAPPCFTEYMARVEAQQCLLAGKKCD
jgi:hypothetical protein